MATKTDDLKKIETFLKRKHCKVVRANEDLVLFFFEGFYGAVGTNKVKDDIKWYNDNSFGIILNSRNMKTVKEELAKVLI